MTVKRLIELLQKEEPSKEVFVEGCDCVEAGVGISKPTKDSSYKDAIMIRRQHGACDDVDGKVKR